MCESCKLCCKNFNRMKILIIPIFLCLILLTIAQVGAFTTLLNNKPVIDLRRPSTQAPVLPQERRKADIFPKSWFRFVAEGNSYHKQILSPPVESTSKSVTFTQNVNTRTQNFKPTENAAAKVSRFTPMPLDDRRPKNYHNIDRVTLENTSTGKDPQLVKPIMNAVNYLNSNLSKRNVSTLDIPSEVKDNSNMVVQLPNTNISEKVTVYESNLDKEDNGNKQTFDETTINANKAEVIKGNASENLTINDLLPTNVEENKTSESTEYDYWTEDELIEVLKTKNGKDLSFPSIESAKGTEMMISQETATDVTITDELTGAKLRETRSVNVIEEENLASTTSGFRFTGREPRVNSNQVFRNINS